MLASFSLGMTFTQSFAPAKIASISGNGQVFSASGVMAWLWQRMGADADAQAVDYGRVVAAAEDFVGFPRRLSILLLWTGPLPKSTSIHGIRLPGERYAEIGFRIVLRCAGNRTLYGRCPRIALEGVGKLVATLA